MPPNFWGDGEENDLPRSFEAACYPDPLSCGETHFEAHGQQYSVEFKRFEDLGEASAAWQIERTKVSSSVIRSSLISCKGDFACGMKAVIADTSQSKKRYKLVWTRNNRLAIVTANRLGSIAAYEKDRGLQ